MSEIGPDVATEVVNRLSPAFTEIYQEGFADGLRWVLGNFELDPADEERIEEALDS